MPGFDSLILKVFVTFNIRRFKFKIGWFKFIE